MEKKDKITLVVFIFLVVSIIFVVGVNSYKTRKLTNVDRKIEYIMGYTYDTILNKGSSLFSSTIELLINKNVFEYTKDLDESIRHYSINNVNNYMKINNFSITANTLSSTALEEYKEYKGIIYFENNYYIEDKKITKNNYIGSIIDIDSYDDNYIIFKSINYYCDNTNYIGIMDKVPTCNYENEETMFKLIKENNTLKINSIKDFLKIVQ